MLAYLLARPAGFRAICSGRGFDGLAWRSNTSQQWQGYSPSAGSEVGDFDGLRSVPASARSRSYNLPSPHEHFHGYRECWLGNSEHRHLWDLSLERFHNKLEHGHPRLIDEKQSPYWYEQLHGRDLLRQPWTIHRLLRHTFRLSTTLSP